MCIRDRASGVGGWLGDVIHPTVIPTGSHFLWKACVAEKPTCWRKGIIMIPMLRSLLKLALVNNALAWASLSLGVRRPEIWQFEHNSVIGWSQLDSFVRHDQVRVTNLAWWGNKLTLIHLTQVLFISQLAKMHKITIRGPWNWKCPL